MSFRISIKVADRATARLQRVVAAGERGIYRAINKVAGPALQLAKDRITSQVALSKRYLDKTRIRLERATASKPYAEIIARRRGTRLSTYKAKQLRTKAKTGKRAKGDPLRRIGRGKKQAGVEVGKIKPGGSPKVWKRAFLIPLKRGKDGLPGSQGMGVFVRVGKGRDWEALEHQYGPSVSQVFNTVRRDIQPEIRRRLSETLRKQMQYEFRKG